MRSACSIAYLSALVTCLAAIAWPEAPPAQRQNQTWPSRVYPGQLGYPTAQDWSYFASKLDGQFITPHDSEYLNASLPRNLRFWRFPGAIVKAKTVKDIQRTVLFARKYNLHLSVRSSGHDFIGRSSHDGSLSLDVENMKEMNVSLNSDRSEAGEIRIQSGATWLEVYTEVDKIWTTNETGVKVGRVIVGAAYPTVGVAAFTLGGGRSPIGRKYGVACDNLLEATIVSADGKVCRVNSSATVTTDLDGSVTFSHDASLFTAICGGGGNSWGVVVDFTYMLRYAPERLRRVLVVIPAVDESGSPINKDTVDFALAQLKKLPDEWGGHVFTVRKYQEWNVNHSSVVFYFNHFGSNSSYSNKQFDELLRHPNVSFVEEKYHSTFLNYHQIVKTIPYYNGYAFNSFVQQETVDNATKRAEFVDLIYEMLQQDIECSGALVGGNMMVSGKILSPVNKAMRLGILSMICKVTVQYNDSTTSWTIDNARELYKLGLDSQDSIRDKALHYAHELYSFGLGSYFTGAAEDMTDWRYRQWFPFVYQSLLNIKKKVDPTNFHWCHNCVGSDLGRNYGRPPSRGFPGQPPANFFNSTREFDEI